MKEKATAVPDETKAAETTETEASVKADKKTAADAPRTEKTIEKAAVSATEKKDTKTKAAEKEAPRAKRGPKPGAKKAAKEDLKPEVFIQFQNKEAVVEEAVEKAKGQFVADGHRVSTIKTLQIYLKPEEGAAYYVINQKFAGRVDLF